MAQRLYGMLERIFSLIGGNRHTLRNNQRNVKNKYPIADEVEIKTPLLEDEGDKFNYILRRVLIYFENNEPYLDPNLKIADVAKNVATNRNYLSRAINLGLSRNFNQLCNYYRVRYACNLYLNEAEIKVLQMCEKSGFNSNSAFLSAFNSCIGLSPAKWCKNINARLQRRENVTVEDYIKPLIIKNNRL